MRVEGTPLVPRLSRDEVEILFVCVLRLRSVRAQFLTLAKETHFAVDEKGFALLLSVAKELNDEYSSDDALPYLAVAAGVASKANTPGCSLTDADLEDLLLVPDAGKGFLYFAYHILAAADFTLDLGLSLSRRFLVERAVDLPVRTAIRDAGTQTVTDWARVFADAGANHEQATAIGRDPYSTLSLPAHAAPQSPVEPTGVPYIDSITDGGLMIGETLGILGHTGRGKSTVVYQLVAEKAKLFEEAHRGGGGGGAHRRVFLFAYEEDEARMRARTLANLAWVNRRDLEKLRSFVDLDAVLGPPGAGSPEIAADRDYAATLGVDPTQLPSRRSRYDDAVSRYGDYVAFFAMTAAGRGRGGFGEVAALTSQLASAGQTPGIIIIDSVDILIKDELATRGVRDMSQAYSFAMSSVGRVLKSRIGVVFDVPVIAINQLTGGTSKREFGAGLDHTDSAYAKNWAAGLDFHAVLHRPPKASLATWSCTKSRRGEEDARVHVLEVEGGYSRWKLVDDEYSLVDGEPIRRAHAGPATVLPYASEPALAHGAAPFEDDTGEAYDDVI